MSVLDAPPRLAPAEITLAASGSHASTFSIADQTNLAYRGLHLVVNVTAVAGTPSISPHIQGKDPVSLNYYDVLVGAAFSTTGTYLYSLGPGVNRITNGVADYLPVTWRISMVHGTADSVTYSLGGVLFPY